MLATGVTAAAEQTENLSPDCVRWNKVFYKALKVSKKQGEGIPETLPDIILGMQAACNWDMSKTLKLARDHLAKMKAYRQSQRVAPSQSAPPIIIQMPPVFDQPRSEPEDMMIDCVTDKIAGILDMTCSGIRF